MKCKVCGEKSELYIKKEILGKFIVRYYRCKKCKFIQTEKPFWLKNAYSSAIINADTGIIGRNITLSKVTAFIFLLFCKNNDKILDYAGGYGIMTRMLRDIGIDCFWKDKYADNLFAKSFIGKDNIKYSMVTAYEFLEHVEDPIKEIKSLYQRYSPNIIMFTTALHNGNPSKDWWYFAEKGGQHISLYSQNSLEVIASKIGLQFSTNGVNLHIFSKKKIPNYILILSIFISPIYSILFWLHYKSKTFSDHIFINKL